MNVCRTIVNEKDGTTEEETITANVMQTTGATAISEHETMRQMFIIMKKLQWKKAEEEGVDHLFGSEDDRLKFKRLCRSVISDGASTALNVSRLHQLEILADLKLTHKDESPEKLKALSEKLGAVAIKSCDMHNVHNVCTKISVAVDKFCEDRIQMTEEMREAIAGLGTSGEFSGQDKGWGRFVYEMFKYYFDPSYPFGVREDYLNYLKKDTSEAGKHLLSLAASAKSILGNRFIAADRLTFIMDPLWETMSAFMDTKVLPAASTTGSEHAVDKLARQCTVFLRQAYRRHMLKSTALMYTSVVSPLLVSVKKFDCALHNGQLWRDVEEQVNIVRADDWAVLRARLKAGQPTLPKDTWHPFLSSEPDTADAKLHAKAEDALLASTAALGEEDMAAVVDCTTYCLHFFQLAARHYAADHHVGGRFHPDNLTDEMRELLLHGHGTNDTVESVFGHCDYLIHSSSDGEATRARWRPSAAPPLRHVHVCIRRPASRFH